MKCVDCGRPHKTTAESLEFETVLCDLCYRSRLNEKQRLDTHRAEVLASRAHHKPDR